MSSTTRYQMSGDLIYQTVANETVIINLENGRYYSLNPTGSVIWEELMKQANALEIVLLFATTANPDPALVMPAIVKFVDELIAEDLLTPTSADERPRSTSPTHNRVRFETPGLEKFTDMEELIPLDPIHHVGRLGWPHRIQDGPDTPA